MSNPALVTIEEKERGEACGCEHGAANTTAGLVIWRNDCNLHQSAPALLAALERFVTVSGCPKCELCDQARAAIKAAKWEK